MSSAAQRVHPYRESVRHMRAASADSMKANHMCNVVCENETQNNTTCDGKMPDTKNSYSHTLAHTTQSNQTYHRCLMSCTGVNCFIIHPISFSCMNFFLYSSDFYFIFRFRKINFVFRFIPNCLHTAHVWYFIPLWSYDVNVCGCSRMWNSFLFEFFFLRAFDHFPFTKRISKRITGDVIFYFFFCLRRVECWLSLRCFGRAFEVLIGLRNQWPCVWDRFEAFSFFPPRRLNK